MTHPLNHQLESALSGDAEPETLAHLAACEACQEYVAALGAERERWERSAQATKFGARLADALASRDAGATPPPATPPPATQSAPEVQAPVPLAPGGDQARRMPTQKWLRAASIVSAPLLAAAAVVLYIRLSSGPGAPVTPGQLATCDSCSPDAQPTRFKGPPQVFVIVERAGVQSRSASTALVGAGVALRVEISLAAPAPIAAGVLTTTGDYIPLLLPAQLDAGTHYSERAARFDAEPSSGWVIVGSPDAVRHATASSDLQGVVAIPLRYTPTP